MLATAAWILGILVWVIILFDAFKRGTGEGLLCLIIPFYALFYLFFRQEANKGWTILLLVASAGLGVAARGDLFGRNDPCKLVTKAAVEQAFGQQFAKVHSDSTARGGVCSYETAGSPPQKLGVLLIADCPEGEVKKASQVEDRNTFRVSGIGDAAVSDGSKLWVQKGKTCLMIVYESGDRNYVGSLQARKRVAQLILDKAAK